MAVQIHPWEPIFPINHDETMKTETKAVLETERLLLRPPEEGDKPAMIRLIGDERVSRWLSRVPHPYTQEHADEWIERNENPDNPTTAFAITLKATGEFMGTVGIHPEEDGLRAEMGFWIGVPYWGHGYCTEAARAALGFAFESLGFERIEAGHLPGNTASANVQEKIGIRYEGTLRWGISRFGVMHDKVLRAIIRPDWEALRSSEGK